MTPNQPPPKTRSPAKPKPKPAAQDRVAMPIRKATYEALKAAITDRVGYHSGLVNRALVVAISRYCRDIRTSLPHTVEPKCRIHHLPFSLCSGCYKEVTTNAPTQ